jgi:hypothetical protein
LTWIDLAQRRDAIAEIEIMPSEIRIYRLGEFVRIDEAGVVDVESSKMLIRRIAAASTANSIENILVDMRDTTLSKTVDFRDLINVAVEFVRCLPSFVRVANLIPDEERRSLMAKQAADLIEMHGGKYRFFTGFEDAIDWLAGVEH